MQELILTGGGSIPVVRDALLAASASAPGREFVKLHAPGLKKGKATALADPLAEHFARGASAIGGASIYFERAYY